MKLICKECDWQGIAADVLVAVNPFDHSEDIVGCPQCRNVFPFEEACDEPECWKPATGGTPTDVGYRSTCFAHRP